MVLSYRFLVLTLCRISSSVQFYRYLSLHYFMFLFGRTTIEVYVLPAFMFSAFGVLSVDGSRYAIWTHEICIVFFFFLYTLVFIIYLFQILSGKCICHYVLLYWLYYELQKRFLLVTLFLLTVCVFECLIRLCCMSVMLVYTVLADGSKLLAR